MAYSDLPHVTLRDDDTLRAFEQKSPWNLAAQDSSFYEDDDDNENYETETGSGKSKNSRGNVRSFRLLQLFSFEGLTTNHTACKQSLRLGKSENCIHSLKYHNSTNFKPYNLITFLRV